MNRRLYWLLALALVTFSIACGTPPSTTSDVESDASGAIDVAETAEETAVEEEAEEVSEPEETEAEESEEVAEEAAEEEMAEETETVSLAEGDDVFPAETPLQAVQERSFDHVKGSNDPSVVVIEYGDFQ